MDNSYQRVSILGCGWFGLPLAESLVKAGYKVKGSTTTHDKVNTLQDKNIEPFVINLVENTNITDLDQFLKTDCLVVSFPPRLRAGHEKLYLPQIQLLKSALTKSAIKLVVFISSTSVYRDVNSVISETNDEFALDKSSPLYQAEELLKSSATYATTVVRFGGLVGGSRHPGRFLAGKTEVAQPNAPVNLIHLEDCIAIIRKIIAQQVTGETFNAVADEHPTRQEFYTAATLNLQLQPPQFDSALPLVYKVISNSKLKSSLGYEFIYPNPMFFF